MTLRKIIIRLIIPIISLFIFVSLAISLLQSITLKNFLSRLASGIFPAADANGFYGISGYVYLGLYGFLFLAIWYVCLVLRNDEKVTPSRGIIKQIVFHSIVVMVLIISAVEITGRTGLAAKYFVKCATLGKTDIQKNIFGFPYIFAKEVRKRFPGKFDAKLITDMDIAGLPGMTTHRVLCYFLYPINIRSHAETDNPPCVIIYAKSQAADFVPENYRISYQFNDRNLVAVRKDLY